LIETLVSSSHAPIMRKYFISDDASKLFFSRVFNHFKSYLGRIHR